MQNGNKQIMYQDACVYYMYKFILSHANIKPQIKVI